ncbi:roadblock/LC7 domain-containing protein [Actinopolyspora sp. H202]|uniref:roadblock/LC7 domain-containing protein n=1 Tax=Actinopolyspora sp. H202 TaxID=1500456 RepID=UPI003EE683DB
MTQPQDLTWLLANLVNQVPHTRSALLLSTDAIPRFYHGLDRNDADRLASLASPLCSLVQEVGKYFGGGNGMRQANAELGDGSILAITAASAGSILAVLADSTVNAGVLSYEMQQLGKKVPSSLATPSRGSSAEESRPV